MDNANILTGGDILGTFNVRPVNTDNVRELLEYLWEPKVETDIDALRPILEDDGNTVHYVRMSVVKHENDFGVDANVEFLRTKYFVDKSTGVIRKTVTVVRNIVLEGTATKIKIRE